MHHVLGCKDYNTCTLVKLTAFFLYVLVLLKREHMYFWALSIFVVFQ